MKQIGQNIKKYRERLDLTQDQVSGFLDINRVQLAFFESGTREISLDYLNKLSNLFNVELEDLIEEDENLANANIAFAFRSNDLNGGDLKQVASFQKVIKNYLKIQMLLNE